MIRIFRTEFYLMVAALIAAAIMLASGCRTNPSLTPIPVPYNMDGDYPQ